MQPVPGSFFRAKLILLLVALPLALAVVGGWQFSRSDPAAGYIARVDGFIAQVEQIQKETGNPEVLLRNEKGQSRSAAAVLRTLRTNRAQALEATWWERVVCRPLSACVMLFGILGGLMGLLGLATVKAAGRRALHSREALLQGFEQGLQKLPWLLGSIGALIALALACGVAFEVVNFASGGIKGRGAMKVVTFGVLAAGALCFFGGKLVWNIYKSSKAVFERDPLRLMGKSVNEQDAPLVWRFVRSVAERAGATMPDSIVLGLDEGFFVTEHPVELVSGAPAPTGRVLYLPLPYMAYMTRAEAEAVIGHELGHFTGADTEYSLRFSPIYATAVNNLRAVAMAANEDDGIMGFVARPAMMLGEYYLDSFDLAVQHWSREREFAADKMGAGIAGNEAIALSLLRISVLAPHVYQALSECWAKGGRLEGGVLNRVRELVREEGLSDPAEYLEEAQAHPTDSHPATRQRLEAVEVPVTPELLDRARSAEESSLLRDLGIETEGSADTGDSYGDADAAMAGNIPARVATGLSVALEEEFSRAAKENADGMIDALREAAALGTERVEFFESVLAGVIGCTAGMLVAFGVAAAIFSKNALIGAGALAAGTACLLALRYFLRRSKKPFMTVTEHGFLVSGATTEVPWIAVEDYGIRISSTSGMQTSVEIAIALEEGYTPPEFSGDRRIKYRSAQQELHIALLGIAKPYKLEGFNEELHTYWRAGNARKALADMEE